MLRIVATLSTPDNTKTEAIVRHAETLEGVSHFMACEMAEREGDLVAMQVYYVSDCTGTPDYP